MTKTCIYTAIYGDYDELKPVVPQNVPCDFVCFTDNENLCNPGGWRIITLPVLPDQHPRMRAKFFKILHHRVFADGRLLLEPSRLRRWLPLPRYRATIWMDGSILVKSPDFAGLFLRHLGPSGWTMLRHPDRDCIYEEVTASEGMEKYEGLPLHEQVATYRQEGHPAHGGLYACGLIGRAFPNKLAELENAWWRENEIWTYQDQLSLPAVLRRADAAVDAIDIDLWKNEWFDWVSHRHAR